jgi:energy-coupling factor transporter ATP-binding protein EcfA2
VSDAAIAGATFEFIQSRQGQLLLHAGGVAAPDGRVVVIHGPSGSGKTTLTASLVGAGLAYLTDETVCLDPDTLAVEPYPKPLTVKPGSQEVLSHLRPAEERVDSASGNWQLDPSSLGGRPIPGVTLRPALIVFPDHVATISDAEFEAVSRARAAFALGEQSSALWAVEPRPLAALARLVTRAPAYRVGYGDASTAAPLVVDLLAKVEAEPGTVEFGEPPEPSGPGPRRAAGVDWLELDDEVVAFDGARLHHLDGPGTAVWKRLNGHHDLPAVAAEIAEEYGADAHQVLLDVEDLVRVLRTQGVVH